MGIDSIFPKDGKLYIFFSCEEASCMSGKMSSRSQRNSPVALIQLALRVLADDLE